MLPELSEVGEGVVRGSVAACVQKEGSSMTGTARTGRWFLLGMGTVQMLILRVNPLVTCGTLCS